MIKYTHVCEKCGFEQESKSSCTIDDWNNVEISMVFGRYSNNKTRFALCPECCEKYGVQQKNKVENMPQEESKSKADELIDLIAEMVAYRIGGNQ